MYQSTIHIRLCFRRKRLSTWLSCITFMHPSSLRKLHTPVYRGWKKNRFVWRILTSLHAAQSWGCSGFCRHQKKISFDNFTKTWTAGEHAVQRSHGKKNPYVSFMFFPIRMLYLIKLGRARFVSWHIWSVQQHGARFFINISPRLSDCTSFFFLSFAFYRCHQFSRI